MNYPLHYFKIAIVVIMLKTIGAIAKMHFKCRGGIYPRSQMQRFPVSDDKLCWNVSFLEYNPPVYNSISIKGKPWSDLEIGELNFKPNWNCLDGKVNRESYTGNYQIVNGYPLNPLGRTGIRGRGVLGRWGPNHAADPIVTRWKQQSDKSILQVVLVKRRDNGEWALPGGMVDPGEKVAATAIREFKEEATNSLLMSSAEKEEWNPKFENFFSQGDIVYRGYVDDPRNTDNAWMETVAYNFHDEDGSVLGNMALNAGDDAVGVQWIDISKELQLYANHKEMVQAAANLRNANL